MQNNNIVEIRDFESKELDIYARCNEPELLRGFGRDGGIFIAESPKVVERALDAGYEPISMLVEHRHIDGEAKHIIKRCGSVPVYTAEFDVLSKITGFKLTRGMLCAMHRTKLKTIEEVCAGAKRIAILENVMNPTNIGAIFRSAAALGMDAILMTPGCSNPLYRRAIRVSMGTVFQIPWTFFDGELKWPYDGMKILKNMGFKTAAMALTDNSVSIDNKELLSQEKIAIILGTEGEGLMAETIEASDYTVKIPMAHGVDSLNVAAASAVAFWQISRKGE